MHAHDEHLLVVGTVEDADPPAFGKPAGGAPEKVVLQFLGARLLEAEDLAALRIDAGHDVPDGAVLAGGVHALEDQQQRMAVGRVVEALQRAQLLNVFPQELLDSASSTCKGLHARRPLPEFDASPAARGNLGIDFHVITLHAITTLYKDRVQADAQRAARPGESSGGI